MATWARISASAADTIAWEGVKRDSASIAVMLFAFNMLSKKKGFPRFLTREDFDQELALQAFMEASGAADAPEGRW